MVNKETPVTGYIYHVYNRGVEKRPIFSEESDYVRFIHDLFEFNDKNSASKFIVSKNSEGNLPNSEKIKNHEKENEVRKPRDLLVNLLAFCLMPNHYHLLLKQVKKNGISKFMLKLGTGYANYFNKKYQRIGSLFQGSYKLEIIDNDSYFDHIPNYIHLNPLDLNEPGWRNNEIKNPKKAIKFLETYRWSSLLDYIGIKNFPSVTQRNSMPEYFLNQKTYRQEIFDFSKIETDSIADCLIE
jgi:putative transposase